ncbi:MAG: glycosyltransferase family 4 protein [Lacibacter sp.]
MRSKQKLLFLALTAFSHMGGIEKFNRAIIYALGKLATDLRFSCSYAAMHDHSVNEQYVSNGRFKPYKSNKLWFVLSSIIKGLNQDVLIIGHLNLAVIAVVVKRLRPNKKLVVICHGIEVFEEVSGFKKQLLQNADLVLAVSNYTRTQLINKQQLLPEKVIVFPNTIDPFFQLPQQFERPDYLVKRYGIKEGEKIIFTLTRLNSTEGYKGYDTVISLLPLLKAQDYRFRYILAGKADEQEHKRMQQLIEELHLQDVVLMPGFIADEEITDHYLLADVFAMPSKGEGFGIVFIEAMACGLQVIAGNKDGSTEALQFGKLGQLVDPDSPDEITAALEHAFMHPAAPSEIQQNMLHYFSFARFGERLRDVLTHKRISA